MILGQRQGVIQVELYVRIGGFALQGPFIPQDGVAQVVVLEIGIAQVIKQFSILDTTCVKGRESVDGRLKITFLVSRDAGEEFACGFRSPGLA